MTREKRGEEKLENIMKKMFKKTKEIGKTQAATVREFMFENYTSPAYGSESL